MSQLLVSGSGEAGPYNSVLRRPQFCSRWYLLLVTAVTMAARVPASYPGSTAGSVTGDCDLCECQG